MSAIVYRFSTNNVSGTKSVGGAVDRTDLGKIPPTGGVNELFDKVLKHENIEGMTDYRLIYLVNESASRVYSLSVRILSSDDDVISIGALPKNEVGQVLATENTIPTSVVFKTQAQLNSSSAGYLTFPNGQEIGPNEFCGLWIRRSVNSSSGSGTKRCELVLESKYRQ